MPENPGVRSSRPAAPLRSDALEVNLERTAVDVAIPERQRALLEILASRYGVQQETEGLLREINHPYSGWDETLRDLRRRCLGDFVHYNDNPRGAEAIEIYQDIYGDLTEERLPAELRSERLVHWIRFQEKVVSESGPHLDRNTPALVPAVSRIATLLRGDPDLAVEATPALRRLAVAVAEQPELAEGVARPLADCLVDALTLGYERWLAEPDPVEWIDRSCATPAEVHAISHAQLRELAASVASLRSSDLEPYRLLARLAQLPGQRQLSQAYLRVAEALAANESPESGCPAEPLHWLCRVVTSPALVGVREQALRNIRRSGLRVLQRAAEARGELLRDLFGTLQLEQIELSEAVLELVATLGVEVLKAQDAEAAEILVEQLLDLEFQGPEFGGFTSEWAPRVNPLHLAHVRTYLRLIEANPSLARRLISALVIQLQTRGLFVADTDLFQRDVSSLLASDIEPVYHLVKTLARLFPVYFEEIGAEGELRRISTEIDEIECRRDPICHFLRKQCHVESNPELIRLVAAVADFWKTGRTAELSRFLPEPVLTAVIGEPDRYRTLGRVLERLDPDNHGLESTLMLAPAVLESRLGALATDRTATRKVQLLARLYGLLRDKYSLEHEDLVERLRNFTRVSPGLVDGLEQALELGDDADSIQVLLDILEALRQVVLSRRKTEAIEDIYHKRHIAVGIPSMYGRYREPRFEAMGLILRAESLANALIERLITGSELELPTRQTLQRVLRWLRLIVRGLRLDGFEAKGLSMGVSMLEQALQSEGFSVDQFLDVFRFMARSMNYLIRVRFLDVYEEDLEHLVGQRAQDRPREAVLKTGETIFRDIIARSFMPQPADRLIGRALKALSAVKERLDGEQRHLLLGYRPARAVVPLSDSFTPSEGRFLLGYKGEMVKQMAAHGLPAPPGFVVTTEVFRCRHVIDEHPGLASDLVARLRLHLAALERRTGRRFGDPQHPLLLSVRSGAAISMPGMMDTFLNVGLYPGTVEQLADALDSPWAAWDSYRRFLQSWGMSYGIDRDRFDHEIQAAKEADGVPKKAQLSAQRMRQLAGAYAEILRRAEVHIPDDPFDQLVRCIGLVQDSWNSEKARVYRQEMRIAEEWGTAALVQQMVFGNLGPDSGTGVLFTRDPGQASREVALYGDFAVQTQGEDIVAGLVATHPISDRQLGEGDSADGSSLQQSFPAIYERLAEWSESLINERGFQHQEIEFTFESPDPSDLYLLQSRDMLFFASSSVPTFVPTRDLDASKVAEGIGVGGGALIGRVSYTQADVERLRAQHPEDAIILLRPDTVPDDIPIILQADGLLTTLGGATCHAAVAAQALGRTCVVGCTSLQVDEENAISRVAGRSIRAGDFISINGRDGSVYLGSHAVTTTRRRELAY